ncbi:hypothetical protein [Neisseria dentiae]|uniref:hypothetical protein n=1 Tax=Neisseria dentiae TaxID=194197 RepID=UPI00211CDDA0|nr:hypothetical protein [Neisseria dentiae]MCQ9326738.1 hypothetical protein [Neisseria dentiae]
MKKPPRCTAGMQHRFTGGNKKRYPAIFTNLLLNVQQNIKKRPFLMRIFELPAGRPNSRKGWRAFILKRFEAHGLHIYKNLRCRRKTRCRPAATGTAPFAANFSDGLPLTVPATLSLRL